jgi:CBS domain-containing protein
MPEPENRLDHALYKFLEQTVAGYMTRNVKTVTRGLTVRDLGDMFERDDFNSYPVEEDGQVIGIVTKFDLLKCFVFTPSQMVPPYEQLMNRTVSDVLTSEFIYVRTDTKLTRVLQLMIDHRVRSVPAIDIDHRLAGIIARRDVLRALADCARSSG